ncbi:MAG: aldehyde ferredoxin oxidoreductase C-terminal domain-containing protein [Pseudomonadota bacterium]
MAEQYGYAGSLLNIDLSSGTISRLPTAEYSHRFLGGRGIAAKLYWDKVGPKVKAFDPENRLILITGPLAGFRGLAGSRWQVCGKSAAMTPHHFSYCNLGGKWGAWLKFAGYDGVVIDGRADKPVYIYIEGDKVEIRDASPWWGQGAIEARESFKQELGRSAAVLAMGQAGENLVAYASVTADDDSSGSSGFGAIMGSKNLKAVVVKWRKKQALPAADPEGLSRITQDLPRLTPLDAAWQPWLSDTFTGVQVKRKPCWGCISGCQRGVFQPGEGPAGKFMCQSAIFYRWAARGNYETPSQELAYHANKLCDDYGLDTYFVEAAIRWLAACYKAGVLNDENTGLPLSKMGGVEFIESLIGKIARREGFGDVLAQGLEKAAETVGQDSQRFLDGMLSKAGEKITYEPRMYITTALLYAMEPRRAIHLVHEVAEPLGQWLLCKALKQGYFTTEVLRGVGQKFFGTELAFDFSTYEGKALTAKMIQDREFAKESLILCDVIWPIHQDEATPDKVGDPGLESRILTAVTGRQVDEPGLRRLGERIWNLQRAILVREGHQGRSDDTLPEFHFTTPLETVPEDPKCLAPGKDGVIISRKGEVVDKQKFEAMKDEYYQLRGWDQKTGLQTRTKLDELGLKDIAEDLGPRNLVV